MKDATQLYENIMKKDKPVHFKDMGVKIGDYVYCVTHNDNPDFYKQHLTIGKKYKIEDLEFRFPDAICVRSDNKNSIFFDARVFAVDIKLIRKKKLEEIEKHK